MVDHLEGIASTLHRARAQCVESRRLLELAAVATMQAATLEAFAAPPEPVRREPVAEPGAEPFRLAA